MASRSHPTPSGGDFLASLGTQMRVIGALILRELHTRYGRDNIGYMWVVAEPMLLATVIGIFHATGGHSVFGGDINPVAFGVLGYTTFIVFRGIVNRAEGSMEANAPLLYHKQVTVLDVIIARALLEIAGIFLTFAVLMGLLVAFGFTHLPARPLALLGAWGYMFWYAIGHSLVITAISHDNRTIGRLVHPYSYFMVGLSGAFTPLAIMPHSLRTVLSYIPMTSIFELLRYGQFRTCDLRYFYPQYLTGACMFLTWSGLVAVSMLRRKIHLN